MKAKRSAKVAAYDGERDTVNISGDRNGFGHGLDFFLFFRVLMTYLKQKDDLLYRQAKMIVKDCNECHKLGDPNYQNDFETMKCRLKDIIGDDYWTRANIYFLQMSKIKQYTSYQTYRSLSL